MVQSPLCYNVFMLLSAAPVVFASVSAQHDDAQCLLQGRIVGSQDLWAPRVHITKTELVSAEAVFISNALEADHFDVGGDRMSERHHNYAPIYEKYMASVLKPGESPTVAETGILTGTGLAMWNSLFPNSQIFGFDINTTSYHQNLKHLRSLGFNDENVKVTQMNQMVDNTKLLQSVFGDLHPHIVVDDGLHSPEAGEHTFLTMMTVLPQFFVYFIEDLTMTDINNGRWVPVKERIMKACPRCKFAIECPPVSDKNECIAVIHSLQEEQVPAASLQSQATFVRSAPLERASYDTVDTDMPWDKGGQPLLRCPVGVPETSDSISGNEEAEAKLREAMSMFCEAGLGSMVEFYVDPRFKGNYEKFKGPDGWIERAYLTYQGLSLVEDKIAAEEDLLVQSIHHFSKYPVVLTSFGRRVSEHMTPERFPNLVVMHARNSTSAIHKSFNFNKLNSMLFTKVKGGVALDADQWVNDGVDVMMDRAFDETTKDYPYPVMPVHFVSRDPESDDMKQYPPHFAFAFRSKDPPARTMRWGHAHPTWTYHALPWLARWTSWALAPEKTGVPVWLQEEQEQNTLSDEGLLNVASWADGLTKQWCKFDIPSDTHFSTYLSQGKLYNEIDQGFGAASAAILQQQQIDRQVLGIDSKYYPKGIPFLFLTNHDAKNPESSYSWLARLWKSSGKTCKHILYDDKWFTNGKTLKEYDPSLQCIA